MKIIFAVFMIVFCNSSLFAQANLTKEEYAIYAGVFDNISAESFKRFKNKTFFVILDNTIEPNFTTLEKHLNNSHISDYLYKKNPSTELIPSTFEVLLDNFKKKQ